MTKAGFLPSAPKPSAFADALDDMLAVVAVTPVNAINPAGFMFKLTLAWAATNSGGSPCRSLTLEMSTSSLARVRIISSISFSVNATFSAASSCISLYEADIFVGMGTGVPFPGATDSPLEEEAEGEPGTGVVEFPDEDMVVNGTGAEVEERLEWR